MGVADILAGAFGGLSQGLGNYQKLKNDEADRLTQAKQIKLQELANARADEANQRQAIEFKRQQAQAFLDAQTDDAEFDAADPNVQMALEAGLKSSFTAGQGPNKLKIKMTPQRQEMATKLKQLELAFKAAERTNQEQELQQTLRDSVLKGIEDGSFYKQPVYYRNALLGRAGLDASLGRTDEEALKLQEAMARRSAGVIGAQIGANASIHNTNANVALWDRSGGRRSGSVPDDAIYGTEEYMRDLTATAEIIGKTSRERDPAKLFEMAAAQLRLQGVYPPGQPRGGAGSTAAPSAAPKMVIPPGFSVKQK